jgi:deoxyadenosine/deoxycytidine kinase
VVRHQCHTPSCINPEHLASGSNLISDYTFGKDCLFAGINLEGDEFDVYFQVHEALAEKIPLPDLILYLKADTDVLMQRIAHRDRPYERDMERAYIATLNGAYDAFFGDGDRVPKVLTIDTNELNYIANPEDLKWVEDRVRQTLRMPPFQSELPLSMQGED